MKFRGLYIVFLLILTPVLLLSQSGNPFDIKSRKSLPSRSVKTEKNQKEPVEVPVDSSKFLDQKELNYSQKQGSDAEQIQPLPGSAERADSLEQVVVPSGINPFDISEDRIGISTVQEAISDKSISNIKVEVDTKTKKHVNFIFWVILFSLIVLAFPISIDRWYVIKIMRSLFNVNISNSLAREFSGFNILLFSFLYFVFIVSLSVFVFLFAQQFAGMESTFKLYLLSLAGVLAIYAVRHTGMLLAKWVFPEVNEFDAYNFTILSFNAILGLSLIIPNLFLAFSPASLANIAMYVGIGIILLFYGFRTIRGVLISFKYLISQPIQFFIYLCAFEILPLLTLYKLALGFN